MGWGQGSLEQKLNPPYIPGIPDVVERWPGEWGHSLPLTLQLGRKWEGPRGRGGSNPSLEQASPRDYCPRVGWEKEALNYQDGV